jgi:hypothetical protein
MKSIEQHFIDWESDTFGFGYGTGEKPVLQALKQFLALCCKGQYAHAYDHEELEKALTPPVAWLLINVLAHDDKIEYGTSPRYGWLTKTGEALAKFVAERTVEQLYDLTMQDEYYTHCYPQHCNCDDGQDCRPHNPFWAAKAR